jgi:hypothetical protein
MSELYLIANGPMPTTVSFPSVQVPGNSTAKTMLQVKLGTQTKGKIVEWGISFDGSSAAQPVKVELLETGTVFGTVTASAAADIMKIGDPNGVDPTTSNFIVGTSATGYTCTSEGSITATRIFDLQLVAPTNQYVKQFPLGREPVINVSTSARIRVNSATTINAYCYMIIEI